MFAQSTLKSFKQKSGKHHCFVVLALFAKKVNAIKQLRIANSFPSSAKNPSEQASNTTASEIF